MKLKVQIISALLLLSSAAGAQDTLSSIRFDQEGFYPNGPKIAVLTAPDINRSDFPKGKTACYIYQENQSAPVFQGELSEIRHSSNSSSVTRIADFSPLTATGSFQIKIEGCCSSYPFQIMQHVHSPVATAALKAFYFQRASMPLEAAYAGKWSRAEGHPDTMVIIHPSIAYSDERPLGIFVSTPGGWYDAGDYNKYIVNSGITMGTLLSAYEDFKSYYDSLHTNIPALKKPVPDILNEILYNLRWMLSMQDPKDGGVYNKCTNANFDPMIMPEAARQLRYVVQKGTAAALDFAAVTAQAARIFAAYKNELPGLSDSCLKASEKAWNWSMAHPDFAYDQNEMNRLFEPKIVTGGYGDKKFSDERFWAASELFIATSGKKFGQVVKNYQDSIRQKPGFKFGLPSWSETGLLGYYSLLRFSRNNNISALGKELKEMAMYLQTMADDYIHLASQNAFLTVMGGRKSDFVWGSNANAANQGILLIQVYFLTRNQKYLNAAVGNLEYILGRNATGYCFVTGFGHFPTMHPHHRLSVADGIADPVPGFVAGGPNPGEQDHCQYHFHEPETAYLDADAAYASNEVAINWNAPLVYLANAAEALENNFTNLK
jgi:endoglucanase